MMLSILLMLQLSWAQVQVQAQGTPAVQQYTFEGVLLERGTRKALADVNVFILPHKLKATTDKKGHFKIENVPAGKSDVVVNLSGYYKFEGSINLQASDNNAEIYVEKQSYKYFETTIQDSRTKKDDTQKTLKQSEFLQMPGSGGDPVKAVQNLPGVNRVGGGSSRVVIQGAEPEDTKYNIEGHEVPIIFHFGGLSSIVTPEAVESVDYLSAGYGPHFGRALGGHVGLNVRKPQLDRQHGMAFMDLFNAGFLVEGPLSEDSGYLVSGRYSYIGYVLKAAMKDNKDFNLTVAPSFIDLNAQYYKKLNAQEEFRFFSIASRDELKFLLNKPIGNDPALRGNFSNTTEFYRFIPQWSKQIDDDHRVTASLGFGADNITVDLGQNYFNIKSNTLSARGEYEDKINSLWLSKIGLDAQQTWFTVNAQIPATFSSGGVSNPLATGDLRNTSLTGTGSQAGLYWKNEVKLGDDSKWTALPGLRADAFSVTKERVAQPRLGFRYAWDSTLSLKVLTGLYAQVPTPQQTDRTYGNPDVKSQRALHYALGFEKDFAPGESQSSTLSGSVFYKQLSQLVVNSNQYVLRDGTLTPENYNNSGSGHIHGFELQSKLKKDMWGLTSSYTYSQSRRLQPGMSGRPSPYDQTHSLNLLFSYEKGPWQYGTRFRYVSGNPYTPIIASTYDADNDVYTPQRGEIYSARNKAFMQLDLRIDRKWVQDTWILSGYIDIQNITAQKNQEGITYSYDYSQKQEITGVSILPTIGVKGEF